MPRSGYAACVRSLRRRSRLRSRTTWYGGGLRLMERVTLRVKDIDFDRHEIVVRQAKGGKDRRVPLADACVPLLRRQFGRAAAVHQTDHRNRVEGLGREDSLRRMFPSAATGWRWQRVSSGAHLCRAGHRSSSTPPSPRVRGPARGGPSHHERRYHEAGVVSRAAAQLRHASVAVWR